LFFIGCCEMADLYLPELFKKVVDTNFSRICNEFL